jgi:hypothetical protein
LSELAPDGLFLGRIVVIVARLTADSMGLGPVENGTRLGSRHAIGDLSHTQFKALLRESTKSDEFWLKFIARVYSFGAVSSQFSQQDAELELFMSRELAGVAKCGGRSAAA